MQWDMLCHGIPAVHLPINLSPARGPHLDVELAIFVGDMLHTSTVFEYFILWGRLSLSRLNHRLPRSEADPEVMQGTAEFHHQIADTLLPQADPVLHDAAALDTTVDVLDAQPTLVECLVRPLVLRRELLAAGFLRRHEDRHLRERERQETEILQEPAPRRQGIWRRVRNGLLMGAAAKGVAQEEDDEQRIHEQNIFELCRKIG